ncbi:MAG: hypothetical protein EON57_19810 [Alphaproteobacteria bacterium]|nr:MAG: hypothetical protein EON57_19810 [Alphaproteobacteria bacterium]
MRHILVIAMLAALATPAVAEDVRTAAIAASRPLFVCATESAGTLAIALPDETDEYILTAVMADCFGIRDEVIANVRAIMGDQYPPNFSDALDARTAELTLAAYAKGKQ